MDLDFKCLRGCYIHFFDYYLSHSGFWFMYWCWRKLVEVKAMLFVKHICNQNLKKVVINND